MVLPDSPELVKIVSQSMPGASIESILEEVRNLIIQAVVDDVSKHNIKSSMETIEYIIQTYNMTSEDTGIVMKRLNHNEFVDSQFFESIYGYVNMKCLNDTDLMCWSGLKKLICTRNKCK